MDVGSHSVEDNAVLFWLIMLHFGAIVSQSWEGEKLIHVLDLELNQPLTRVRGFVTNYYLPYHNDATDVVALLCLQPAMEGGLSSVASTATAHDIMAASNPDLLEELYQPFHMHGGDSASRGEAPTRQQPIFFDKDDAFCTRYLPFLLRTAHEALGHPIPARQTAAMDVLDATLESDPVRLDMDFQPGDIQILNNRFIVHSRTAYRDWPDLARKRHLLRLWLDFEPAS